MLSEGTKCKFIPNVADHNSILNKVFFTGGFGGVGTLDHHRCPESTEENFFEISDCN